MFDEIAMVVFLKKNVKDGAPAFEFQIQRLGVNV